MEDGASKLIPMTVHNTVSWSIIMIDEMQLNVQIRNYRDSIKRPDNFIGYCLAFITTTLALVTADFSTIFGIDGKYWEDLFLLIDGGILVLTCLSWKKWYKREEMTPDDLIEKIKLNATTHDTTSISIKPY